MESGSALNPRLVFWVPAALRLGLVLGAAGIVWWMSGLVTGLAFGTATSALAVVKRHYPVVIGTGGAVLIAMGILIWTGEFTQLNITVSHWLQSLHLPNLNSDT